MCNVDGCDRPTVAKGKCMCCYMRVRNGIPLDQPRNKNFGRQHSYDTLLQVISYSTAHNRVKYLWGSASLYPCVDCGEPARDWSYDGTDPTELRGPGRHGEIMSYSVWPEYYAPRCKRCHTTFDHGPAPVQPDDSPPW